MARLVMKSPYFKPNRQTSIKRYVQYIATREGVEIVDNSKSNLPPTVAQKRFINKLLRDIPEGKDLHEYEDYSNNPTRSNASELINTVIESQADSFESREKYVSYIAERPRVEKLGEHGLFSDEGVTINLAEVKKEVAESKSNVWTHIISLKREDAEALGYNRADAWIQLLRSNRNEIARQMHIPPEDLRWYAAFHNEAHHPHVHMIAYSVGKAPFLSVKGIEAIKSTLATEIFRDERMCIYNEQTAVRDELKSESRAMVSDFVKRINEGTFDKPEIKMLLFSLADKLEKHKGKKVYGYLRDDAKGIINSIVDELENDEGIKYLYDEWYKRRFEILRFYSDETPEKIPLSQNKTFKSIKNMIIQEACNILVDRQMDNDVSRLEEFKKLPYDYQTLLIQARKGNHWAEYKIAKHHLNYNSDEYNPKEAADWLEKSFSHGNIYAAYLLGKIYLKGEYLKQDIPKSVHLLEYAYNEGNTYAGYQLGRIYLYGIGVEKDFNLAIEYLTSSASDGNEYAELLLHAVKQNRYALAASSGLSVAQSVARIIQDNINEQERKKLESQRSREQTDRKEREKTDEKKRAHGQKISM